MGGSRRITIGDRLPIVDVLNFCGSGSYDGRMSSVVHRHRMAEAVAWFTVILYQFFPLDPFARISMPCEDVGRTGLGNVAVVLGRTDQ